MVSFYKPIGSFAIPPSFFSKMDREQEELQFLGLFGIFKESYKIIVSWRKIFAQITLTLILPLTFIFLAHIEISHSLFKDIKHTEFEKEITRPAAVVYTIASIYTGRELTFKKVMSVVPKVWKRLMVTFLCMFAAFFVYNFFAASIIVICFVILPNSVVSAIILYVVLIVYLMGFVYMTVIWQLASVVSVLESSYGIKAMTKSMDLIKGNRVVAVAIFFLLNLSLGLIQFLFSLMVVHGSSYQAWKRVGFGVLCFVLLLALFLFGLVIQTILYLVCKSYHHENIDKGDLSNHLESYLGEYEPLNGKEVQLEQYDV
uniref:Polyadenylate-binding protein 1-B-binding protein n=1 Tax=Helianthus annuus TaxID=4232 RepID=A0A251S9L8_HELAN